MNSVTELVRDHRWLPHRIDAGATEIQFVRVDREQHRMLPFLDERFLPSNLPRRVLPFAQVAREAAGLAPAPSHFLFHSSLALSTLLVRLLDLPGVAMGLKEPNILTEVASLARHGRGIGTVLTTILQLLGRPFGAGEAIVVKPGDSANNLIPEILALRPDARALILYAPLPEFLASVAKRGVAGRVVYRRLFTRLRKDRVFDAGFSDEQLFEQTDLQITAMAWLTQQARFAQLCARGEDRLRSLDSETLLARKGEAIEGLGKQFGLDLDVDALLASPIFSLHSKQIGRSYDGTQRRRDIDAARAAHGEEIGIVAQWAEGIARRAGIALELPCPLLAHVTPKA